MNNNEQQNELNERLIIQQWINHLPVSTFETAEQQPVATSSNQYEDWFDETQNFISDSDKKLLDRYFAKQTN